ncbi:type 1 fimbrial protein [Atlantibacter sp. RC6]|uniref:type 1 fimbrial protein n=1 Tax=Atlantibacter sp. RC6 TaxID=2587036 RepID=UPI0016059DA0|nr:type 1 fimbrial protein [Atlantibacter sp. RC6]MBB3324436.1 type 1 fimbria pilin [Atlantibacter sp. RC6]
MNKRIISMNMSALILAGLFHCAVQAEDVSATLSITGQVTQNDTVPCSLYLNTDYVQLIGKTDTLINQNDNATGGANIQINIGGNSYSNECKTLADEGKLAYKFVGTADDADGTVLANSDVTYGAAKGVGVGVFVGDSGNNKFQPLRINHDVLTAKSWGNTIVLQMVKLNGKEVTAGKVQSALTIQFERL